MKFGYLTLNNPGGIRPDVLARELEHRGFESIWVPEHSHIPTSRQTGYPGGGDLPDGYWQMMDPFVSLMAAATASTRLRLATGICLALEHDLLDLACTVATLDVLSQGRVLLGVGVGWNKEELANHRPDVPFNQRYLAMRERLDALRTIWADDEPEFDGRWDRFSRLWSYPKPLQQPTVPIALGSAGQRGIKLAATHADAWCPIDNSLIGKDGRRDVHGGIELFRRLAAEAGRDPDAIPITIFAWSAKPARLESYAELGVERVVLPPPSMWTDKAADPLTYLDSLGPVVAELATPTNP